MLDAQMTLDTTEEQYYATPYLVKRGHGEGRILHLVGQGDQFARRIRIEESASPREQRERLSGLLAYGLASVVAAKPAETVDWFGVVPCELEVALRTGHEVRTDIGNENLSEKVQIGPIHQIEASWFELEAVEPSHIVLPGTRKVDAWRNRTPQVDLRVDFQASHGPAEIALG